ncbi:MAG: FeMo cofactor biosynthesis protein NifB [Verrucomicrobia bacterium ADurb.Bin474]|nr:MAG: FeMo cofactor biosynthesis protein NifB [Verrucomicrobia bacterium ADurb.Bin474]
MDINVDNHPCFNPKLCHKVGRMHLPVAPRCNVMCNFCNRKYDCVNESRPGVTSTILSPRQALAYVEKTFDRTDHITVVGIAGPGDPFANPDETMETLRLVRAKYPEVILCLSTNGLGIAPLIPELARLKVTHVTVTITAVDPEIAAKVYGWVRWDKKVYRGLEAGTLMIRKQLEAVRLIKEAGMIAKVNTILMAGINDGHISEVARTVSGLGADVMNIIPMIPVEGAAFADLPEPDRASVTRSRLLAGEHIRQMLHCARCRSDAVVLLGKDKTAEAVELLRTCASLPVNPTEYRPCVAVATQEGMLVNLHLGEAHQFHIFSREENGSFRHESIRMSPPRGSGDQRWEQLARSLRDCRALLVSAAGPAPREILEKSGVKVVEMEGMIEDGLACVFEGRPIPKLMQKRFTSCGAGVSCRGTGTGCD